MEKSKIMLHRYRQLYKKIETENISKDVERIFDTSNYELDRQLLIIVMKIKKQKTQKGV